MAQDNHSGKQEQNWLDELIRIMAQLRGKNGCPWDRQQTHQSLKRYLVEETAELLDAIDHGDPEEIMDELGDVLLNIIFHAQIAAQEKRFNIQDVARRTCEKLIRRHPHVFGDTSVDDAAGVVKQWEQIKQAERCPDKDQAQTALHGVPQHLPALHRAYKVQKKAARVGFDWPCVQGVFDKIQEELAEIHRALDNKDHTAVAEEIGDLLFAVTNLSRFLGHSPEDALHRSVQKFERRFLRMEQWLQQQGKTLEACDLAELEALWNRAKQQEPENNV